MPRMNVGAVGLVIAVAILGILLIAGMSVEERSPREMLIGLWQGEEGYLFVPDDPGCSWHTSVGLLRKAEWRWKHAGSTIEILGEDGRSKGRMIVESDSSARVDRLKIVPSGGEAFLLCRDRIGSLGFLDSMGSYTEYYFWTAVLYPDGIYRLAALYCFFSLVAALIVMMRRETSLSKRFLSSGAAFLVLLMLPVLAGYLFGTGKWIFFGWWDPLNVGRAMIYSTTVILVCFLFYSFAELRRFKRREVYRRFPSALSLLFWLFVMLDVIAALANFRTMLSWID